MEQIIKAIRCLDKLIHSKAKICSLLQKNNLPISIENQQIRSQFTKQILNMLHKILDINFEIKSYYSNHLRPLVKRHIQKNQLNPALLTFIENGYADEAGGILTILQAQNQILAEGIQFFEGKTDKIQPTTPAEKLEQIVPHLTRDLRLLKIFKRDLARRFQQKLTLNLIGFGEISSVLEFVGGDTLAAPHPARNNWVYKRMPVFPSLAAAKKYAENYHEYFRIITGEIGIQIPPQKILFLPTRENEIQLYALQHKIAIETVGHQLLHIFSADECAMFFHSILGELKKIAHYNRSQEKVQLAIDAQISNWAWPAFKLNEILATGEIRLVYIDTSTPLFQINTREQLDPELFLKSAPFFLRPIIRAFFLEDVLNRYYDIHLNIIDLIANFYKESHPEYIPRMIKEANNFFLSEMAEFQVQPITLDEVKKYYREDAFIWRFFLAARKIDRFITEKILRKKYPFRLPDYVKR